MLLHLEIWTWRAIKQILQEVLINSIIEIILVHTTGLQIFYSEVCYIVKGILISTFLKQMLVFVHVSLLFLWQIEWFLKLRICWCLMLFWSNGTLISIKGIFLGVCMCFVWNADIYLALLEFINLCSANGLLVKTVIHLFSYYNIYQYYFSNFLKMFVSSSWYSIFVLDYLLKVMQWLL